MLLRVFDWDTAARKLGEGQGRLTQAAIMNSCQGTVVREWLIGVACRACAVHFQQQKSNALVRKELQAHLLAHQQLLAGYTDYIRRHTHALLQLVLNRPQVCGSTRFLLKLPSTKCIPQCLDVTGDARPHGCGRVYGVR